MKSLITVILLSLLAPVSNSSEISTTHLHNNSAEIPTAIMQLLPLAEAGDAKSQYNLALIYDWGDGTPENNQEAIRWYTLAAEQGDIAAQYNLALMYDEGEGVPENNQQAIRWYTLAAEQGDKNAQDQLYLVYAEEDPIGQILEFLLDRLLSF